MNSNMPSRLRVTNPTYAIVAIRLVLGFFVMTSPTISTPVFAFQTTTEGSSNVQDVELSGQWVRMEPTGARAIFEMPKKPRYLEKQFSPFPNKPPIKVRLHMATVADGNLAFVFSYHDLHAMPVNKNTVLDGAVRGSYINVLGQLVDAKELGAKKNPQVIDKDGYPGRQFVFRFIQNEKTLIATSRVYLVDKRLYQFNCIMAEDIFDPIHAARFLKSFEIIAFEPDLPPRPRSAVTD